MCRAQQQRRSQRPPSLPPVLSPRLCSAPPANGEALPGKVLRELEWEGLAPVGRTVARAMSDGALGCATGRLSSRPRGMKPRNIVVLHRFLSALATPALAWSPRLQRLGSGVDRLAPSIWNQHEACARAFLARRIEACAARQVAGGRRVVDLDAFAWKALAYPGKVVLRIGLLHAAFTAGAVFAGEPHEAACEVLGHR